MPSPEDFDRVGELLGDACEAAASTTVTPASPGGDPARSRGGPRDVARAIADAWAEVVGVEVAENATPVRLTRGSLVVSTSSSVWADTLGYMSIELAAKLNERVGEGAVTDIVFRHAGWEERSRPRASGGPGEPERRRLSAEEERAVAEIEKYDLPPALKDRAMRAMRRSLERGKRTSVR